MGKVIEFDKVSVTSTKLEAKSENFHLTCDVQSNSIWFSLGGMEGDQTLLDELITSLTALRFKIDEVANTSGDSDG